MAAKETVWKGSIVLLWILELCRTTSSECFWNTGDQYVDGVYFYYPCSVLEIEISQCEAFLSVESILFLIPYRKGKIF